jgi:hypothetical protein
MLDANGRPCVEAKTTLDLESTLHMASGNIFHGALASPKSAATSAAGESHTRPPGTGAAS